MFKLRKWRPVEGQGFGLSLQPNGSDILFLGEGRRRTQHWVQSFGAKGRAAAALAEHSSTRLPHSSTCTILPCAHVLAASNQPGVMRPGAQCEQIVRRCGSMWMAMWIDVDRCGWVMARCGSMWMDSGTMWMGGWRYSV